MDFGIACFLDNMTYIFIFYYESIKIRDGGNSDRQFIMFDLLIYKYIYTQYGYFPNPEAIL